MLYIPSLKDNYKHLPIVKLPPAPEYWLPLAGYRGEMELLYPMGSTVRKYQPLAKSVGAFGTAIHAPVSGILAGIQTIAGKQHVLLKNDFEDDEYPLKSFDIQHTDRNQWLQHLRDSGLEGSGGARFPTALKFDVHAHTIDTLIVNAAECEPFLSADYATLRYESNQILRALGAIKKLTNARKIVIGIEKHNADLQPILQQASQETDISISLKILPNGYPQGGELQLIHTITGKKLPKGSIPAQQGILMSNVGTVRAFYHTFFENKPYTERLVTLYDDYQKIGRTFSLPIGTPIAHLLEHSFLKESTIQENSLYILGGPMMGQRITDLRTPIHKGSGGLMVFPKPTVQSNNCINCGYCVDVCPQHLLPLEFVRHTLANNTTKLKDLHLLDCIECGACAYVCPSHVPLMSSIYQGKNSLTQQ